MSISRGWALPLIGLLVACGRPSASEGSASGSSSSSATSDSADTSTEVGADTSSDSSTNGGFVPDTPPLPDLCDPWVQDCLEGEKCVPYASSGGGGWDSNKCVPVLGAQVPGEPCTYAGATEATDDCDATSVCWPSRPVGEQLQGFCSPFCTGNPDAPMCAEGQACAIKGNGAYTLCLPTCDPVAQDCDADTSCFQWSGGYPFLCQYGSEQVPSGQPCSYDLACSAGDSCVAADVLPACGGQACCTPFCDLAQGDVDCAAVPGSICAAYFQAGEAPLAYEHVGVCLSP